MRSRPQNAPVSTPRRSILPILLVNFIGTMGFSIVLPFLVFLVTRMGGNAVVYGIVGATYPAFQLIGAPLLGRWSDHVGRKRTLFVSQAGTLVSWIVFAIALKLPVTELARVESSWLGSFTITLPLVVIFAARALDGLTGGNVSVANAYLADVTTEEERSRDFGRLGMSSSLGFILGPALASLFGALGDGEAWSIYAALAISVVALVAIALLLPETRASAGPRPARTGLARTAGCEPVDCTHVPETRRVGLRDVFAQPGVGRILVLYFLIFLGFSFFYVAFPVRASGDLGWSVGRTGLFFTVLSGLMVLVQGPLLARLAPRVREIRLIVGGNLLLAVNFALMTSTETAVIFAAAALFALGNGTMWPTIQAVLARTARPDLQGATQGLAGAAGSLASILGLLIGGLVYERLGGLTFVLAGALLVVVAILASRWCRARSEPELAAEVPAVGT